MNKIMVLKTLSGLSMPLGKEGNVQNIIYDAAGTASVTTFYVVKLMQLLAEVPPVKIISTVVEGVKGLTLVDGSKRELIRDLPLRFQLRPGTTLNEIFLHLAACSVCGEEVTAYKKCGCANNGTVEHHFKLTPGQALAAALLDTDQGSDCKAVVVLNTAQSAFRGSSAATKLLLNMLRAVRDQLVFTTAPGAERLSTLGVTKVRNKTSLHPKHDVAVTHPSMIEALSYLDTSDFMVANGFALAATSPSHPTEMVWSAGYSGLASIIEHTIIGAYRYLHPDRHTPCAQALANAVTLVDNDLPPVLPESNNLRVMPGGRCLMSAIMADPSNVEDMIGVSEDVFTKFTFKHEESYPLQKGDEIVVTLNEAFVGHPVLYKTASGVAVRYDSAEHRSYAHMVEVLGELMDEVRMNDDGIPYVAVVAKSGTTMRITTIRQSGESSKFSDGPNKGVACEFTKKLFVNFAGSLEPIQVLLSPSRAGAPKFKACSILVQARMNQVNALQARFMDDPINTIPVKVSNDMVCHMLAATMEQYRETMEVADFGSAEAAHQIDEQLAFLQAEPEAAMVELGMWPIYELVYEENEQGLLVSKYVFVQMAHVDPAHFWMLQPQLSEVNTGSCPVGMDTSMFKDDEDYRFTPDNSKSGGSFLEVERMHLALRSPEVADFLFEDRHCQAAEALGLYYLATLNIPVSLDHLDVMALEETDFTTEFSVATEAKVATMFEEYDDEEDDFDI